MQRICFILQVKPEKIDEYKRHDRNLWPELKKTLTETGWHNDSLFPRPNGMLIGSLETENFEQARSGTAARDVNVRWPREMADFFVPPEDLLPDQTMAPIEEVFHV
ncbi:MAG: L-rhamnose mutarotase [Candidatus Acidiferrales bacterium]